MACLFLFLPRGLAQDPEKRAALAQSSKILENIIEIMKNTADYTELETREWVLAALWSLMLVLNSIFTSLP